MINLYKSLYYIVKGSVRMKKCEYCGKEISYFDMYCSDECQRNANDYYERVNKFEKLFGIVNMICIFGIPVGIVVSAFNNLLGTAISAVCCFILGLLILIIPIPVDSMISKFKIQKSQKIIRICGIGIIVFGMLLIALNLLFIVNK